MNESNTPGDYNSNGNLIRVVAGQVVAYPDAVILIPVAKEDYDAYEVAVEDADVLYDLGDVVLTARSQLRNNPASYTAWADGVTSDLIWEAGISAQVGLTYEFDGVSYICIQTHTTQSDWTPPVVPALFTMVRIDLAPWVQPIGSTDAYRIGERVTHNGVQWSNGWGDIEGNDANVWEPGTITAWVEIEPTEGED